jgi:hypothetical protein
MGTKQGLNLSLIAWVRIVAWTGGQKANLEALATMMISAQRKGNKRRQTASSSLERGDEGDLLGQADLFLRLL